ncbi:MAG: hypothetical protein A2Y62_05775 [Candidatus Fischerbacteria bacterium RBG_13_37_8]|uniref:indole-3-glycerol-phosphate synthase n=1 Tax=Candidatus Fischerbacteria bacterium RBG_13_37_8 TaxID=1817863 RepID=A0A1F5VD64_9BACT|nr:MAG: hypothetical protein A2Y62_05775 [Candidatus Fischerbacteria bacterium RBG_13_37_8]
MSFLKNIVEKKKVQIGSLAVEIEKMTPAPIAKKSFSTAIGINNKLHLIAEIKRSCPSHGIIKHDLDIKEMVQAYEKGGASALSIITEQEYFKGSFKDIVEIKHHTSLPVLAKDFIIDVSQVTMAHYSGADAILLIMNILDDKTYRKLFTAATEKGMEVLAEVHSRDEITRAMSMPLTMIGVNRRNLNTLIIDKTKTEELASYLPERALKIAESGIDNKEEFAKFHELGYNACLIGSSIVRSNSPEYFIRELLSCNDDKE